MNKQEVIDKIEKEKSPFNSWEGLNRNNALDDALDIVEKLDEPEKPVVPQFVADFYESIKDDFEYKVYELCLQYKHRGDELPQGVAWWFGDSRNKPIETLVMMHKFGYKVKKEKLYTVELPNPNSFSSIILRRNEEGKIYISFNIPNLEKWKTDENVQLTESEIKEDFGWAWNFAKDV